MTAPDSSFAETANSYIAVMDQVEGWLSVPCAGLLSLLHAAQQAPGVRGETFEIGVHRGKSSPPLSCASLGPQLHWLPVNDLLAYGDHNLSTHEASKQ